VRAFINAIAAPQNAERVEASFMTSRSRCATAMAYEVAAAKESWAQSRAQPQPISVDGHALLAHTHNGLTMAWDAESKRASAL
jgi:hypothetical protein